MTIRKRFKSAIKRGTGEAHLIMMSNPAMDFTNDIIKAALTNYSYDNQSEGSRATYVFELIELSQNKEKIRKAIIHGLLTERQDTWALDQLFDLSALFAKQGDKEAYKAIYKRFYKKTIQGSEWVGQDAILELDGLEGLKYIAETKGKIIASDPEEYDDSFMVDFFQEENPTLKVYEELEKASENNKYIRIYLDSIKKHKFEQVKRERPIYNYEIVKERIDKDIIVPLAPAYSKDLSDTDIQKLANDFLNEQIRGKLEKYLRVFDKIKYPYDYNRILEIAKRPNNKKDRLIEYAVNALRYFSGNDIRDFALDKIKNASQPEFYTNLLIANYREGDGKMLMEIVNSTKNEHRIHHLVFSYVEIYKANKTKDCREPLIALYNKLTCGIHRKEIVEIMIENKVLPVWIKNEIKYDSDESTRELYK